MPRRGHASDDDPDFSPGAEDPEEESLPEMICPACRAAVTEDTQKCPHCGDWITPIDPSAGGWRRWVFIAVVLLMLYAILRWTF